MAETNTNVIVSSTLEIPVTAIGVPAAKTVQNSFPATEASSITLLKSA